MPRKYVRKTQRKTRLLKLNVTSIGINPGPEIQVDPRPEIHFDDEQWRTIEKAYGVALSADLKRRIVTIVREYLWQDQREARAPYLRGALHAMDQLKRRIDDLQTHIEANSGPVAKYALSVVNVCFARSPAPRRRSGNHSATLRQTVSLVPILAEYSVACEQARRRLIDDSGKSGFREGRAWRSMIWKLLDIAEKSGLPCTIGKPNARQKRPSLFVSFVRVLQKQLPGVHWDRPSTIGALATAISRVRSDRAKIGAIYPKALGTE